MQKAYKKGVLIISAAGNEANESHFYPASLRGSMSVGAVDKGSKKAWFNNVNNQVEISAPGVDIESATKNNEHRTFSGASMGFPGLQVPPLVEHPENGEWKSQRALLHAID